jgi:hypothetical protein
MEISGSGSMTDDMKDIISMILNNRGGNCHACGKPHEGNCLMGETDDGKVVVVCDKCRRVHDEANRLMGLGPDDGVWVKSSDKGPAR